jgi:UDP-N-acetyl-D-galactosamine dehydrogenase
VKTSSVAVVGLGYVGLPLAVEFGKALPTFGYDLSAQKVATYQAGHDPTGEVSPDDLRAARHLTYSTDPAILAEADVIVVAVPTPVDEARRPDFGPLVGASTTVGRHMKRGAVVVFESTVYPGATEEICIPVLEQASGLVWKRDFHVGYSPERVNPGDKTRTLRTVVKVVAGDDEATLALLAELYGSVVDAGIHRASSIKVAEAAKVIENTQRDLNIALMNELALVFDRLGIDTLEVLEAAGTKWNFLPFRPGLVGGHCIGVDPYYLTHKAEMVGYNPQVILAGRRINDGMAEFVATTTVAHLNRQGAVRPGDTVVVLGLTFKEDCPDLRNSKVADLIVHLTGQGLQVVVHDPMADPAEAMHEYGVRLTPWDELPTNARAVVMAVAHRSYRQMPVEALLSPLGGAPGVFVDIKSVADRAAIEAAGHLFWRL